MATGFGYVRDSKPMQIDWQDIGKQMSDNIGLEMADRQKRKDDIDQKIGDYKKALLDQPQGSNAETNRFFADFTSDAGDAMRNAERLLKSSQLSERDFYKFRANANQGTDLMFTAGKKFNEGHDEAMRRFGAGESQAKENWMRQQTEGFLNFSKNGAYINPLTGEVNVARRYKDARGDWQISTTPGDFANASELVQQATAQYNSFDLDAAVTKAVNGLGATLIQQSDGRSTKQFFQAMQEGKLGEDEQKLLNDAKKNMVASFTVDPNHISSILTGNIGVAPNGSAYDFTYDETEANNNPHLILVNPDGTNNFETKNGKAQKEAVEKYADARFAASLGGERREKQTKDDTAYDKSVSKQDKDAELSYELAYDITLGGPKQANNKQIILANNDTLKDLNETEDTWVIEYKDNRDDKIIQKIKKTVNGEETYDREATAEALYTIVDPNSTPVKSQKARQNYFKTRDIKQPVSTDLLQSTRQPTPASNTTNYYTNQEISKGKTAVPISAQIESITDLDEDSAPELESIIRGIQTLSGTDNFFDPITVKRSPAKTAFAEVVRVTLPDNIAALLKDKPFVRSTGSDYVDVTVEGGPGGISEEEGKSNLNQLVDSLIAEMTNKHNSSKGVKKKTRSISQIMKEDGVSPSEAQKIFNAQ